MPKAIKQYLMQILIGLTLATLAGIAHLFMWIGSIQARMDSTEKTATEFKSEFKDTIKTMSAQILDLHKLYVPQQKGE